MKVGTVLLMPNVAKLPAPPPEMSRKSEPPPDGGVVWLNHKFNGAVDEMMMLVAKFAHDGVSTMKKDMPQGIVLVTGVNGGRGIGTGVLVSKRNRNCQLI